MGRTEEMGKQEAERAGHIWCTSCGRILPEDSVYCEFCGSKIEHELQKASADGEKQPEKQRTDSACKSAYRIECQDGSGGFGCLRRLGWKKAAAAGVIAACGLALSIVWAFGRQKNGDAALLSGYIKDNSLFVLEENGASRELSEACLRDWKDREELRLPEAADWIPVYWQQGRTLWYPEQIGDGSFSLMNLYNKEGQKADSGAVSVQTAGETAAYEKINGGLYVYSKGKKQKLAASVSAWRLGSEGDYLIWQEVHPDQTVGLYGASLDEKGRAEKEELLERDAELLEASGDLKQILYKKEGEIWLLEGHSEKIRLVEDVNQVFLADADDRTLFFTRKENGGESLYFLDGKQAGEKGAERLLDQDFLFLIHGEDGILTYKASGEEGEEIRIAGSESSAALDWNPDEEISLTVSGDYGWYLASPEPGAGKALYRVSLKEEDFGAAQEAAQEADRFCGQYQGIPFYLQNVHGQAGDLYFGEEALSYDVKTDSVCLARDRNGEETGVYFLADYDGRAGSGTLMKYSEKGRGAEEIDINVSGYLASEDEVLYFTDCDPARGRGTLNRYVNGKTKEVDSDVWAAYGRSGDEAVFARQNQAYGLEQSGGR